MKYVYLARSEPYPERIYIRITSHLKARLAAHDAGQPRHSPKFKPWSLVTYTGFGDESEALAFDKYLKSASARAFARKRPW